MKVLIGLKLWPHVILMNITSVHKKMEEEAVVKKCRIRKDEVRTNGFFIICVEKVTSVTFRIHLNNKSILFAKKYQRLCQ